jgi:hypothetical protein
VTESENLKNLRAGLKNPDDLSVALPQTVSEWAALTDDELLGVFRKMAAANLWTIDTRFGHEFSGRLIDALKKSAEAAATSSRRLERMTRALVWLTMVLVGLTIVLVGLTVAVIVLTIRA